MRVRWLQHVSFEGPTRIGDWFRSRGIELIGHRLFDGDQLPEPSDTDFLVVPGGNCADELSPPGPTVQTGDEILARTPDAMEEAGRQMDRVLSYLCR